MRLEHSADSADHNHPDHRNQNRGGNGRERQFDEQPDQRPKGDTNVGDDNMAVGKSGACNPCFHEPLGRCARSCCRREAGCWVAPAILVLAELGVRPQSSTSRKPLHRMDIANLARRRSTSVRSRNSYSLSSVSSSLRRGSLVGWSCRQRRRTAGDRLTMTLLPCQNVTRQTQNLGSRSSPIRAGHLPTGAIPPLPIFRRVLSEYRNNRIHAFRALSDHASILRPSNRLPNARNGPRRHGCRPWLC